MRAFVATCAAALSIWGCAPEAPADDEGVTASTTALQELTREAEAKQAPVTISSGSTGHVEVEDFFIGATFYTDNLILRAKGSPECVAHLQTPDEPFAPAGTLRVSSELVGTPGGPPALFAIEPDSANEYYEFPDPPLFDFPDGTKVELALSGAAGLPPIERTRLRSSPFGTIILTAPLLPDTGVVPISHDAPLLFSWQTPAAVCKPGSALASQRISLRLFVLGAVRWAQLYCSWPLAQGRGKVPAALLSEVRKLLGGEGALDAVIDVYAGELKEITSASSSYVVFVTTDDATTLPRSTSATLL